MGRVVKLAEVRKGELVDCAEALFFTRGYDNTTVADIIIRAGVSKGGFYHHFASKEELLDALIERWTAEIIAAGRDVLEDTSLDALTKLNRFLARGQQWKLQAAPQMRSIHDALFHPIDVNLYQRVARAAVAALGPVMTRVVEQGIREGIFDAPDPEIVGELLLSLGNARFALLADAFALAARGETKKAAALLEARVRKEEMLVERVLGLKSGSVRFAEPGYIERLLSALR
jgi:AcrR family transcriptional regulator